MLFIGVPVFAILIYHLAVKKTISLYHDLYHYETTINESKNAPQKIALLKKELKQVQRLLSSYEYNEELNQEILLAKISAICEKHKLTIREVPSQLKHREQGLWIFTNQFRIEGEFTDLLQLIYNLEQKEKSGRISSVDFEMYFDKEQRKEYLLLNLYIQNTRKG